MNADERGKKELLPERDAVAKLREDARETRTCRGVVANGKAGTGKRRGIMRLAKGSGRED